MRGGIGVLSVRLRGEPVVVEMGSGGVVDFSLSVAVDTVCWSGVLGLVVDTNEGGWNASMAISTPSHFYRCLLCKITFPILRQISQANGSLLES